MPLTNSPKPADEHIPQPGEPERDAAASLDEISAILRRMLALAEMSASDLELDRGLMQKTLDRLREEIDRIADSL